MDTNQDRWWWAGGAVVGVLILLLGWQMGWLQESVPTEDENTAAVTITNIPPPAIPAPATSSAAPAASATASAPATSSGSGTAPAKTVAPPVTSFSLAAADAATLKAWIAAQKTPSNDLPGAVTVGAQLPLITTVYAIPASAGVPSATKVSYTVVNNMFVLVDPDTYKVVYVFS